MHPKILLVFFKTLLYLSYLKFHRLYFFYYLTIKHTTMATQITRHYKCKDVEVLTASSEMVNTAQANLAAITLLASDPYDVVMDVKIGDIRVSGGSPTRA